MGVEEYQFDCGIGNVVFTSGVSLPDITEASVISKSKSYYATLNPKCPSCTSKDIIVWKVPTCSFGCCGRFVVECYWCKATW